MKKTIDELVDFSKSKMAEPYALEITPDGYFLVELDTDGEVLEDSRFIAKINDMDRFVDFVNKVKG